MVVNLIVQFATLGTALLSFGAASFAWRKARGNSSQIHEVHVLVNQRMTDVQERVIQLVETMNDAGVDIPADPKE
jgi:hypothetical protein